MQQDLSKLLQKEKFTQELRDKGMDEKQIQEEWNKHELLFKMSYLEEVFYLLNDEIKQRFNLNIELTDDPTVVKDFITRMSNFMKRNSDLVSDEQKAMAIRKTFEKMQQVYDEVLKKNKGEKI